MMTTRTILEGETDAVTQIEERGADERESSEFFTALGDRTRRTAALTKLQPIRIPKFDENNIEGSLHQLELLSKQLPRSQHAQLIVPFLAASSKARLGTSPRLATGVGELLKGIF